MLRLVTSCYYGMIDHISHPTYTRQTVCQSAQKPWYIFPRYHHFYRVMMNSSCSCFHRKIKLIICASSIGTDPLCQCSRLQINHSLSMQFRSRSISCSISYQRQRDWPMPGRDLTNKGSGNLRFARGCRRSPPQAPPRRLESHAKPCKTSLLVVVASPGAYQHEQPVRGVQRIAFGCPEIIVHPVMLTIRSATNLYRAVVDLCAGYGFVTMRRPGVSSN